MHYVMRVFRVARVKARDFAERHPQTVRNNFVHRFLRTLATVDLYCGFSSETKTDGPVFLLDPNVRIIREGPLEN